MADRKEKQAAWAADRERREREHRAARAEKQRLSFAEYELPADSDNDADEGAEE